MGKDGARGFPAARPPPGVGTGKFSQNDRGQGTPRYSSPYAPPGVERDKGIFTEGRRVHRAGISPRIPGHHVQGEAEGKNIYRLSSKRTGSDQHRGLFDKGKTRRPGIDPHRLGRTPTRCPVRLPYDSKYPQPFVFPRKRPMGGLFFHPPVDHGKDEKKDGNGRRREITGKIECDAARAPPLPHRRPFPRTGLS